MILHNSGCPPGFRVEVTATKRVVARSRSYGLRETLLTGIPWPGGRPPAPVADALDFGFLEPGLTCALLLLLLAPEEGRPELASRLEPLAGATPEDAASLLEEESRRCGLRGCALVRRRLPTDRSSGPPAGLGETMAVLSKCSDTIFLAARRPDPDRLRLDDPGVRLIRPESVRGKGQER